MNEDPASISGWCDQVAACIERLAGPDAQEERSQRGRSTKTRDVIEVTLIGPYSSGKSSLLRRLLADEGIDIPDWCTVSGRRETFELNEVVAGSVSFTDAPGFASTNVTHEQLAEDALALSDAFILVVPPNLMTSRVPLAASFLSGSHYYGRPGGELADKVIAVIGQADTLGVDPEDDVDGMRELAGTQVAVSWSHSSRTQGEAIWPSCAYSSLRLTRIGSGPDQEPLEGILRRLPRVGRYGRPGRGDHVAGRAAGPELRDAAKLRYFSRIGRAVTDEGSALLEQSKLAADDLRARSAELSQLKVRGDALAEAAEADLQTRLVSLGTEMAEELSGADADATTKVEGGRWRCWSSAGPPGTTAEVDLFLGEAGPQDRPPPGPARGTAHCRPSQVPRCRSARAASGARMSTAASFGCSTTCTPMSRASCAIRLR